MPTRGSATLSPQVFAERSGRDAVIYLTARDPVRGTTAAAKLRAEGLQPAFHQLDVTDEESVSSFADFVRTEHGGVDIVISNAAARMTKDVAPAAQVRKFIETNNHGTYQMIRSFSSLLRDGGRFVVVASSFGRLRNLAPAHHSSFDVERCSLEEIEGVMDRYTSLVEEGREQQEQWPGWMNIPSKVGQVASVKILARQLYDNLDLVFLLQKGARNGALDKMLVDAMKKLKDSGRFDQIMGNLVKALTYNDRQP